MYFGLFFFSYQMFWLVPFVGRWTGNMALGVIPLAIVLAVHLPYFILLAWMTQRAYALGRGWLVPLIWASVEAIRIFIPIIAIPTGFIALPLWVIPELTQSAAYGTIVLTGALVAWVNSLISDLFEGIPPRVAIAQVSIILFLFMMSVVRWSAPNLGPKQTFSIGQLGVDLAFGDQNTEPQRVREAMREIAAMAQLQKAGLLILPEGMMRSREMEPQIPDFDVPIGIPYIYGLQRGFAPAYQSSGAFDGKTFQFSDKARLVAFGEYVPLRDVLGFASSFNLPQGDLHPTQKLTVLNFPKYKIAPILCFEAMFPDIAIHKVNMGGQFIAVQSIDDWYLDSPLGEQLLGLSAFRAVENGVPLLRSASQGNTAAFDSRGNIKMRLPLYERRLAKIEMPIPAKGDAFAGRLLFPPFCILIVILGLGIRAKVPVSEPKTSQNK